MFTGDGADPALNSYQIALRILESVRDESVEAGISAACELIYYHARFADLAPVLKDWGSTDDVVDPLRAITKKGARRLADQIENLIGFSRESHYAVFEQLLHIRAKRVARAGLSLSSSTVVTRLMAGLVGPGERLLDPACGIGGTLLAAAKAHPRTLVTGVDVNPEAVDFAVRRLWLAGQDATIELEDWLREEPSPEWDAIIAEPPMGTRLRQVGPSPDKYPADGDTAWLSSIVDSLSPAGRGVVLLPAGFASKGGPVAAARDQLLKSGRVEAIIALPAGSALDTNVETCIWIVSGRQDPAKRGRVLLMNAAGGVATDGEGALTDIGLLLEICRPWLDGAREVPADDWVARFIEIDALVQASDARPKRHLAPPPGPEQPRPTAPGRLLTELRLSNFKSVAELINIPLKPLTLVYGKNSAGKSSLIQALLLMKQSTDTATVNTSGPYVNLGSFPGVVHNHDLSREMRIGLSFASAPEIDASSAVPNPSRVRSLDVFLGATPETRDGVVRAARSGFGDELFTWQRETGGLGPYSMSSDDVSELVRLAYETNSTFPPRASSSGQQGPRVRRELTRAGIESIGFSADGLLPGQVTADAIAEVARRVSSSSRVGLTEAALRTASAMSSAVSAEFRNLLGRLVYLGPLRQSPERVSRRETNEMGVDIPFFLLDNTSEREAVSTHLQRLGMQYELDAVRVSDVGGGTMLGDLAALVLTDIRSGAQFSPADVGFGVSQVLPIVVELSARSGAIIAIEQPEIHLHPAMQADLADLLIESVDENGRANQVIAETHSENLMLRLQRRIREGVLDSASVAVLYVDQDDAGSAHVQHLRMDATGEFVDEWPNGFFVERFDELFGDYA